jgi:class 3 adenylate cyclase/tetratricopeptide (TPR) repeat protein
MNCTVCGELLPESARFCPNCGALVATPLGTEERKMVTVLFADLVDSTGLGQRLDPERAREVLGRFFDAATAELQALRGRPEKFIGDAVMAVFGLPTVHEDDALRAVRAGLAIRARLRRLGDSLGLSQQLEVRVGIESGEAAAGVGPAGQLLVTGSVVNAAARLQAGAAPGEVLVGPTTFALTESAVSYGERRDVLAKGFDGDLAGLPVEGLTIRSARRTIPFVGRGSELTMLRESLIRASETGQPVLVTVLGEPGIGKSRLADELVAGLGEEALVLTGRARSYADTATFAPVATIVAELAGVEDGAPADVTRQRLRRLVERTGAAMDIERVVDRLSLLFGISERRHESAFVHDVQSGFLALIDGLARDRSVVLVFEDAQELKPPMLDLVERLGGPARDAPRRAMVLALARADLVDARPTWASNTANAVTLRLIPLPIEDSIELVRQAGGGRIGEDDAAQIAARAGGNPFFIIETTGMLLPGEDPAGAPANTTLPPTVQAIVAARLDALPPRLRELARRASIFFVSFDLPELAVIDPDATAEDLRQLEEAEILVREDGARADRWRVRHSMLKDVAYASVPKRERVRLHQLIAELLAKAGHPSWAAEHLELAALASLDLDPQERAVAEPAADALLGAGDRARRRTESRSAIDYYQRALALGGPEERWAVREARALAGMGEAHYWLGEYPAATEALDRAVALGAELDDAFTLALALRFLGDIAINVEADLERAEALLDRSLAAAEELGEPWAVVRTLLFAGWVPWTRGDTDEAGAVWRRALEVADPDDGWARVRALNSLSINLTGGPDSGRAARQRAEQALRLSEEASELAESVGDQFSIAITAVQRARVLEDLDRREESLPCLDGAIATFHDLGARWEFADATAERGIILRDLGRLGEAEEDLRTATRISEELGELQLASWTWRALSRVSELRGDHAEAERQAHRSREAEAQFQRSREDGASSAQASSAPQLEHG